MDSSLIVNDYVSGDYELPVVPGKKVFYIVPLSGGIDSYATGYSLLAKFPTAPFTFVHCDTGVEAEGTEEGLKKFEKITGRKIIRIKAKYDLLEMVEKSGNFLPSQLQRTCTNFLKTLPTKYFYQALREKHGEDAVFIQFVGLRADEPERTGIVWKDEHIASAYPLQSLGLVKSDVNNIVQRQQGIPIYYMEKSRSGCFICIFSRRSEIVYAWSVSVEKMIRAANLEDIPQEILSIYKKLPTPVHEIVSSSRNWLSYYRPSRLFNPQTEYEKKRGKNKLKATIPDLFGAELSKRLYVAVEYQFYNNDYGLVAEPFVYFEQLITYSTSLGGLKTALKHFWLHRIHTKELHDLSENELGREKQIQIIEIEVDNFDQVIPPKPEGVFTWQNDRTPLYAIRKAVAVIERILLTEGLKQDLNSRDPKIRKSAEEAKDKIEKAKSYGRILSSFPYEQPSLNELIKDKVIKEAPEACMACSR